MRSRPSWAAALLLVLGSAVPARAHDGPVSDAPAIEDGQDRISRIAAKFKGSILLFDQSITPDTIDAGAQQSQIPSYQWWFSFRPRYYIKPYLSIRARLDLTLEWANAVNTTLYRQPLLSDFWTDLAYTPPKFAGIESTVSLRAVWGTSLSSQAETDVVDLGPSASLARTFHTRIGELELALSMYGLYHFTQNTSGGVQAKYACSATDQTPTTCSENTGYMDTQFSLTTFVSGKYSPHPKVSFNVTYGVLDSWAYDVPQATVQSPSGQMAPVAGMANDTRFRQNGWFLASVDYDPVAWLTLSLGYYCLRPILNPDSTYGDPLYSPGGNTRIFLTTTFNLDKVYESAARRYSRNHGNATAAASGNGLTARF